MTCKKCGKKMEFWGKDIRKIPMYLAGYRRCKDGYYCDNCFIEKNEIPVYDYYKNKMMICMFTIFNKTMYIEDPRLKPKYLFWERNRWCMKSGGRILTETFLSWLKESNMPYFYFSEMYDELLGWKFPEEYDMDGLKNFYNDMSKTYYHREVK